MSELVFEPDSHTYTVGDRVLPCVSDILNEAGVFPWSRNDPEPSFYMERGRAVHAACEYDDDGSLVESSITDVGVKLRLDAYRKFKRESRVRILLNERPLYHRFLGYAGTLDRLVVLGSKWGVLDIKCGSPHPGYGLQTAAYEKLVLQPEVLDELSEVAGISPRATGMARWSLHLDDQGRWKLVPHEDRGDYNGFLHCLGLYKWKENHLR